MLTGIADAAKKLKGGDIFFLTYSGHGGQAPDLNGDERDGKDETWCLYDGELIDDELYSSWGAFAAGVRILLLSDSCHSGTVSKALHYAAKARAAPGLVYRVMPDEVALRVYQNNKKFYDPILKRRDLAKALGNVKASVLLISGCQDNQLSEDGTFNGLFTGTLKTVWNGGTFRGIVPPLSHRDRRENAAGPIAEAVAGGREQRRVHCAEAVHDRRAQEGPGCKT